MKKCIMNFKKNSNYKVNEFCQSKRLGKIKLPKLKIINNKMKTLILNYFLLEKKFVPKMLSKKKKKKKFYTNMRLLL